MDCCICCSSFAAIAAEQLGVSYARQTRTELATTNTLLQNQFPYLGTDFSFSMQSLPADTSRDCNLLLLPAVFSSVAFLASDKAIASKLRLFRPRIFILGWNTLILGVFTLYSWAAPILWLAHFSCGWISLKWLAHSMALQEYEIIALGQLHGQIQYWNALHLNPSSGFIL